MRIIAGKFRGRRLKGPKGLDLRPTSDRLRETLFNVLAPWIEGAVFLDLFAGTGAVGLEALSRGAREVVFVDSSPWANRLIRENIALCSVQSGHRIVASDVFTAVRWLARERVRADIAFADPPYDWGPYGDLVETLFETGVAAAGSRIVVEHHRKAAVPESGRNYRRVRTLEQGDHCLSFYLQVVGDG
jgi:16S rRNA (guanine966-N2)-methyltransferase